MMKTFKSLMTMLPVILLLSACAGVGDDSVPDQLPIRLLFSSTHCTATAQTASLTILSSEHQWHESMMLLRKLTGQMTDHIKVSFEHEFVLQINMGQKTTGGYSLRLLEGESTVHDGWADIHTQWKQPAQGMMLTQALTSPCVILALPRHDYQGIRVLDQTGRLRLETALK